MQAKTNGGQRHIGRKQLYGNKLSDIQWHSQDTIDARAQHVHTTFVQTSAQSVEAFRGLGNTIRAGGAQPAVARACAPAWL